MTRRYVSSENVPWQYVILAVKLIHDKTVCNLWTWNTTRWYAIS